MNFTPYNMMLFVLVISFFILFFKVKSNKIRWLLVAAAIVFMLFPPVKFKQEGMSSVEQKYSYREKEDIKRFTVSDKTFKAHQEEKLSELRNQSKELLNEIE